MQNKSPLKSTIADTIQIKQTWRPQKVGVYVPLMLMRSKRERGGATMGLPWVPTGTAQWCPLGALEISWISLVIFPNSVKYNAAMYVVMFCFRYFIGNSCKCPGMVHRPHWAPSTGFTLSLAESCSPRSGWGQWRIFERSSKTPYALLLYLCFLINCLADTCSDLDCDYI